MLEQMKYLKKREIIQMQKNLDIHLSHRPPNLLHFFGQSSYKQGKQKESDKIEVKDHKEEEKVAD